MSATSPVRTNGSDPTRSCRTAILRAGVEGDGRLWRGTMDGVDHRFKQNQPIGWQAEASANHDAIVAMTGQAAFNRRDRRLVRVYEAVLAMPPPRCEIGKREFDPRVDLFRGHAGRQRWVRKVHCCRIKTDQHYAFHQTSLQRGTIDGQKSMSVPRTTAVGSSYCMDQPEADSNHHRAGYAMN